MTSHVLRPDVLKLMVCTFGFAIALMTSADAAQKAKQPRPVAPPAAAASNAPCRGANVYHCGPLYNAYDYLGNDPDPFIRAMIERDLGAKYGPAE